MTWMKFERYCSENNTIKCFPAILKLKISTQVWLTKTLYSLGTIFSAYNFQAINLVLDVTILIFGLCLAKGFNVAKEFF